MAYDLWFAPLPPIKNSGYAYGSTKESKPYAAFVIVAIFIFTVFY